MAWYCNHYVEFEGREFEVRCRYNVPMLVRILRGEDMAGIGSGVRLAYERPARVLDANDVDEEDLDDVTPAHLVPEQNRVVRAVEDILIKEGTINERGCCICKPPDE